MSTIKNPIEWSVAQLAGVSTHAAEVGTAVRGRPAADALTIRTLGLTDLREALRLGLSDTLANRTDIPFLCLVYPFVGLFLTWAAFDYSLLPLVFPAASGFALIGPVAAVGLYELSRRREQGAPTGWGYLFSVLASPSFGAIFLLGLALAVIFAVWIATAQGIYAATLGPEPPETVAAFISAVLGTPDGWTMIAVGSGVGFLFAAVVLVISIVSFPLLLDMDVGLRAAVTTSVRVAMRNPVTVAVWGLIVAGLLVIGSVPLFLGLIFVMPLLGHATWHFYRRAVVAPGAV